jgi:hypothetical protein
LPDPAKTLEDYVEQEAAKESKESEVAVKPAEGPVPLPARAETKARGRAHA